MRCGFFFVGARAQRPELRGAGVSCAIARACAGVARRMRGHFPGVKAAEENRAHAKDTQDIAVVEGELAMLAAQLAAIRRLRGRVH